MGEVTSDAPDSGCRAFESWRSASVVIIVALTFSSIVGLPTYVSVPKHASADPTRGLLQAAAASLATNRGPTSRSADTCQGTSSGTIGCATAPAGTPGSNAPDWTNLSAPPAPSPRYQASMVYDPADGYVVLFGGIGPGFFGSNVPHNDTWIFSDGRWTNITATAGQAPSARYNAAITYDTQDGYVLLFGGFTGDVYDPCQGACNDSWSFHAGKWTKILAARAPAFDDGVSIAYDAADGYVVALTSRSNNGTWTWTYRAGTWSPLSATNRTMAPESLALDPEAMAYDAADGYVVMFGGYGCTNPPACSAFGYLGNTWKFSGGNWTNLTPGLSESPSPRSGAAMAYNPAEGNILLFGGSREVTNSSPNKSPYWNDTWIFAGGTWTQLSPGLSPPGTGEGALTDEPVNSLAILFGGESSGSQVGSTYVHNYTWVWAINPPIAGLHVSVTPDVPAPGTPASFAASFFGGTAPFSYAWSFGDGGISGSSTPTHAFASNGDYTVRLRLNDSAGHSANASLVVSVYAPLRVAALAARPNPAFLGQPVSFTSAVSGGTPPYTVAWSFGDGGTGGNLPNITHVYTTDGPFRVVLTATDAVGGIARSDLNITIALTVQAFANRTSGVAPLFIAFSADARGGVPVYAYSWSFGDGATSHSPDPTHAYDQPGSYIALVTVTDAAGHVAHSAWHVSVSSPGALGGPGPGLGFLGGYIGEVVVGSLAAVGVGLAMAALRFRAASHLAASSGAKDRFAEFRLDLSETEPLITVVGDQRDPAEDLF